jgi:hypothetical protein
MESQHLRWTALRLIVKHKLLNMIEPKVKVKLTHEEADNKFDANQMMLE